MISSWKDPPGSEKPVIIFQYSNRGAAGSVSAEAATSTNPSSATAMDDKPAFNCMAPSFENWCIFSTIAPEPQSF
jgi:hypothetical protein